ncbi:MAG: putative Ig domain-containing protein, partial [Gammaproteobacteria bacterium]|nr:putative Ig domain-containing protein [Gammaproteobacteria bacterium]
MQRYLEPPFDPREEPGKARKPAPAKQLRQFVDAKAEVRAPATVRRYLTSLAVAQRALGLEKSLKNPPVQLALKRMHRKKGRRQDQATGLTRPLRQRPPKAAGDSSSGLASLAALALLFAVSNAALAQTTVTQSGGGATWSLVGETSLTTGQTYTYTLTLTDGAKPQNEHFGLTSSTLGLNRFKRGIDTCSGGYYFCYAMRNVSMPQEFTVNNVNFAGHVLGPGSPYEMTLVVALDTPVGTQVNLGVVDRHGIPRADAMQLTVTEAADTTAPRVSDATVDGASLVITFNEDLATAANLANSAFTVKKTSSRGEETTVTLAGSPSISGATVTLTLTPAVVSSDAVTVSYAKPTSGMDNALEDAAGNRVARFTDQAVTNNTPNNPPTAADNTVTTDEDTAYTFAASDFGFADADAGDALASVTITALESAGDLELDGADVTANQVVTKADIDASKLRFTPAENANGSAYATFRFTVSDGADDSASSYTMTIDVTAVNDPPTVANAIPDQSATEGAAFGFQFAANTFDDVDDATLAYAAVEDGESGLPSWLGFDPATRTFSGTPASTDVGTVTVKVTASDDDGASASDTFVITVSAAANNPPTAADSTVTTDEDTAYTFAASDFNFADADAGDALASVTITALESAGDLELDGADVTANQVVTKADIDASKLRFTPAENANGSAYATFRFTVSDGADDSASSYTMTIDVTAVNDPPTVANAIPDQSATEGAAFGFQFAANTFDDVDDATLAYAAVEDGESGLPSWLGFDPATRTFSGTPASTDVGTVTVKVTASDDDGASVSDAFVITVSAAANNPATGKPGIDGTPQVGQTLTTTAGNMADDDSLPATTFPAGYSFQWVQVDGPTETEISGATSQTYVPVAGDVGRTLKVKVTFTDGGGAEEMLTSDETDAVIALPAVIPTLDSPEAFFANGALRYRFDLRLSEGVSIPHEEMRDHAFSVTNGHMDKAQRIHKQRTGGVLYSNHWRMTVAPDDETKPVTVTLRGDRPCGEEGALCTAGGGRLLGSPTLTLSTDTEPPDLGSLPSLSIADTSGTEDSANLAFDVSLSKAVSATIAVDFQTVSGGTATANADYREANYRIVFSAGETVQPGSVALIEDDADDAGETVNVEIANARVITPRGAEFGPLSITRGQATGTIDAPASSKTPLPDVNMRIENTSGSERGGWLHFTIALSRALDEYVCYDFETLGTGTASEGIDYLRRPKSTLWQPPGVTEWTDFVRILDDSIDDGGETVQVRISDAELCDDASKTVTISRAEATGTITNSDPIPAAWLGRFGRTVADQVIDAVESRMGAAAAPGTEANLAGQRVGTSGAPEDWGRLSPWGRAGYGGETDASRLRPGPWGAGPGPRAERVGDPEGTNWHAPQGRGMTARELLFRSSFSLAASDARTGSYALWGRGSVSRFDGRDGDVAVDGEVASAFLGADWSRERTTAGLILGHSIGDGGYHSESGRGTVSSTLTGLYPWMRQALGERISLWGVAGYGEGALTVTPANADRAPQAAIRTDLGLGMGAVGLRGTLAQAPDEGGFELAVKTDAMGVRTRS